MEEIFIKNGFVIKSYEEQYLYKRFGNSEGYFGVGRYLSWPLDTLTDSTSINLTTEALERWFGFRDKRLWVIPDFDYLQRYIEHCHYLNIEVFGLQVESQNSIVTSGIDSKIDCLLGYDYSDIDISTSCLFNDLITADKDNGIFSSVFKKLNKYGLFDTVEDARKYLSLKKETDNYALDIEEYFSPNIIKISKIKAILSEDGYEIPLGQCRG